jgi:hypothetical protein
MASLRKNDHVFFYIFRENKKAAELRQLILVNEYGYTAFRALADVYNLQVSCSHIPSLHVQHELSKTTQAASAKNK